MHDMWINIFLVAGALVFICMLAREIAALVQAVFRVMRFVLRKLWHAARGTSVADPHGEDKRE